jgi:hypothetical protein
MSIYLLYFFYMIIRNVSVDKSFGIIRQKKGFKFKNIII